MPFHALPNPNMIWQSIEEHALPDATIIYSSVWKGMPFYALPYHIGVWKGMEGHKKGNGYKLEEGPSFYRFSTTFSWIFSRIFWIPPYCQDRMGSEPQGEGQPPFYPGKKAEPTNSGLPVCQSRPSIDGFARLDGHLGKIARLTPVFLQFCPS